MQLYSSPVSGNAFKIRLFLSLLKLDYDCVDVDLRAGDNRRPAFLELNPRGEIPVLVDGDLTVWDSQAILVYLARRYGTAQWLPEAAPALAQVMQWLAVAGNELLFGLARARAVKRFGRPWDLGQCQDYGRAGLVLLEQQLSRQDWLAAPHPTIADIACYPYVALAPEGDIALEEFPAVRAWIARVQALPGYVDMDGIARIQPS